MRKRIYLYFFILALVGCDNQVSDYVSGVSRNPSIGATTTTLAPTASQMYFKITPAKVYSATAPAGAINATATLNNRRVQMGADMAMTVNINRSRKNPQ